MLEILSKTKGYSLIFIPIMIPVVLALIVLVFDFGRMVLIKHQLQAATDAAAIAGTSKVIVKFDPEEVNFDLQDDEDPFEVFDRIYASTESLETELFYIADVQITGGIDSETERENKKRMEDEADSVFDLNFSQKFGVQLNEDIEGFDNEDFGGMLILDQDEGRYIAFRYVAYVQVQSYNIFSILSDRGSHLFRAKSRARVIDSNRSH